MELMMLLLQLFMLSLEIKEMLMSLVYAVVENFKLFH